MFSQTKLQKDNNLIISIITLTAKKFNSQNGNKTAIYSQIDTAYKKKATHLYDAWPLQEKEVYYKYTPNSSSFLLVRLANCPWLKSFIPSK